ncbi:MAG: hypothetical protein V2A65_10615 [Candidatus Omnitrophota bacterium]
MEHSGSSQWLNVIECGASGSGFETTVATTAGSRQITTLNVGDFRPGQDVVLSKCCYYQKMLCCIQGACQNVTWSKELGDRAELRGYDGRQGDWLTIFLDMPEGDSAVFRWSEDFGRTWHPVIPITGDWQSLRDGMEVRFNTYDWENGYTVLFSLRSYLATTIEAIEENKITLRDAPMRSTRDSVMGHRDDDALQAVIDRAIREKKHVCFPVGHYRLMHGLFVNDASGITIEGASGVDTVFDIRQGEGACLTLTNGTEVNIRNFRMVGHSGYDKRDCCGNIPLLGAWYIWGFFANWCAGVGVHGTERVLLENCHGTGMSHECFYSRGPHRQGAEEPEHYTKDLTFLRCSVVDSARNAFNNNDRAENTSVLYCRIVDVGGCSWEGASRFVRFIGNYVRNAGPVAMGNIYGREADLEKYQSGQHIVADNVFEGRLSYGGYVIGASAGAAQIIIRNNLFVNYNSSAVQIMGTGSDRDLPAANATVTGNIFDMTNVGEESMPRTAIHVAAPDMLVSDNQIYVRNGQNPDVTAIRVTEPALNANIHDNLIRNCGAGIVTAAPQSNVGEIFDPQTFSHAGGLKEFREWCCPAKVIARVTVAVPYERRQSHRYRGWTMVPLRDGRPAGTLVIEDFDPETLRFKLREPHGMESGQAFEVIVPAANWNIHDNTIDGCLKPVRLVSYGSPTSLFRNNLITRGAAAGVMEAVVVSGVFTLAGNTIAGFDEPGSAALVLFPDRFDKAPRNVYRGNVFEQCSCAVRESGSRLWESARSEANLFIECKQEVG